MPEDVSVLHVKPKQLRIAATLEEPCFSARERQ
jgi:hypothetical protein